MTETTAIESPSTRAPWGVSDVYDALAALGLLVVVWAGMWVPDALFMSGHRLPQGFGPFEHERVTPLLAFVFAALCFLPLAFRRRWPRAVLVATTAAVTAYQVAPVVLGERFPPSLVMVAMMVALYTAAAHLTRRRFLLWALPCAAIVLALSLPQWGTVAFWTELIRNGALLAVAGAFGDTTRNRRAYLEEALRRAAAAEKSRDEVARRRVDEERLRIARELHDVTAHSLSIVAVQSGVALHVLDTNPEAARTALTAIRETSRASLQELRGMLGVLRASGERTDDVPLTPTPGLGRIEELVRPLREAGVSVDLVAPAGGEVLPAMVDASAYRIVQEALTNALRHAGTSDVRVMISRSAETLSLEVTNTGAQDAGTTSEGHGIAGMRERAVALGGTFSAGPLPGGGWRVAATLPLTGRSA